MQITDPALALESIVAFLVSIGLAPQVAVLDASTLLPGVDIGAGKLLLDRSRLLWPGDLLHEAGHIAVTPAALRPTLNGALDDHTLAPHAGEVEATAWAFAAVTAIGLHPALLFHAGGYHGASERLIFTYTHGVYPGAGGLSAAGMVASSADVRERGLPAYPAMLRWLRE